MNIYLNLDGDSGVSKYEIGEDRIIIEFSTGATYLYTYSSASMNHIETMKELAIRGDGLNSYINRNVRRLYERKLR